MGKAPRSVLPMDMNFKGGRPNYAMRALNETAAWNSTLDNFEDNGKYSSMDLSIKTMTVKEARATNSANMPVYGMTNISVLVGDQIMPFESYRGDGSDISKYQINVRINDRLTPESAITTLTHEVAVHAQSYADKILQVQNGNKDFATFASEYRNAALLANSNPDDYMSPDHILIGQGGNSSYKAIRAGVLETVRTNFDVEVLESGLIGGQNSTDGIDVNYKKYNVNGNHYERHKRTWEVLESSFTDDVDSY